VIQTGGEINEDDTIVENILDEFDIGHCCVCGGKNNDTLSSFVLIELTLGNDKIRCFVRDDIAAGNVPLLRV